MTMKEIAKLLVDVRKTTTDFVGLTDPKAVVIYCAILVLFETGKQLTAANISDMAGYNRRDTTNHLQRLVASNHLKRLDGSGRAATRYELNCDLLTRWLKSSAGVAAVRGIKASVAEVTSALIVK